MVGGPQTFLRVAVIGCGAISEEHLPFLASSSATRLDAVCDLSPALAELTRSRYRAAAAFTDVDEMLSTVRPDSVHVLSPPRTHPDLIERSLAVGAHVICEKPLAPTAAVTKSLLDAARLAGRHLIETRNLLFNDVVRNLDELVDSGSIGEIREVDVALALDLSNADVAAGTGLPLGLAHDYLPHLAYLFGHFAGPGSHSDDVVGHVGNFSGRPSVGFDHVDVLVAHRTVRGRLRISPDVAPSSLRLTLRGTAATVEADVYQPFVLREGAPFVGKTAPFGQVAEGLALIGAGTRNLRDRLLSHGTYHGMPRMLDAVYTALLAGRALPITEDEVLASAQLIDAIAALAGAGR